MPSWKEQLRTCTPPRYQDPRKFGRWMAGRRYDRVLAAKHEPSYPLRPATGTSAPEAMPESETEQCPLFYRYRLAAELQKRDARMCALGKFPDRDESG